MQGTDMTVPEIANGNTETESRFKVINDGEIWPKNKELQAGKFTQVDKDILYKEIIDECTYGQLISYNKDIHTFFQVYMAQHKEQKKDTQ